MHVSNRLVKPALYEELKPGNARRMQIENPHRNCLPETSKTSESPLPKPSISEKKLIKSNYETIMENLAVVWGAEFIATCFPGSDIPEEEEKW